MDKKEHKGTKDEIMTIPDLALYLKVAEKTVLRMIHKGEIPGIKIGGQWRFMRSIINDWLLSKMKVNPQTDLARLIEQEGDYVPLSRLIFPDLCVLDIKPGTKEDVLSQLIQELVKRKILDRPHLFLQKLLEREALATTALGVDFAIPHLRHPEENLVPGPMIVVGICPQGTEFGSLDGNPTHVFFLVITDNEIVHLRIMSKLGRILREKRFVQGLRALESAQGIVELLIQFEQTLTSGSES